MSYDLKDAMVYLADLVDDARKPHEIEINGKTYCDKSLKRDGKSSDGIQPFFSAGLYQWKIR